MPEYEVKTMQKDIDKTKDAGGAEPPEKLPVPPGAPLPAEPSKPLKPEISFEPPQPEIRESFSRKKIFIPIILIIIILLLGGGFYYWWNYMRTPKSEIPAFLIGVSEIKTIESLNINVPVKVSNALEGKYTFFSYVQPEGNRVGFVVKVINRETLETDLKDWEITMKEDLKPIFLNQELSEPVTTEFQDSIYRDINIRYLNFTDSTLAIDYALIGDYFVITTSKDSMYKVIDRILEK